jgi:hypothetical protein
MIQKHTSISSDLDIHTPFPSLFCYDKAMNDKKRMWVWVGIAVVVVVIAVVIAVPHQSATPVANTTPTSTPPVYAPQGQLASGFPKQLVLDTNSQVNSSYAINYSTSTNLYTTQFNSSSSMATMYANYNTYLTANGWTIARKITSHLTSRGIVASNATSEVLVTIVAEGKGSQVTVTYDTK